MRVYAAGSFSNFLVFLIALALLTGTVSSTPAGVLVCDTLKGYPAHGVLKSWDVITSSNGIEALEAVEFKNPDLIITELNLPQMDGVEFLQTLKESGQNIPVIVVSSVSEKEGSEKVKDLGIKKYLSKPFQLDELRESIGEILNQKEVVSDE